VGVDHAEDVVEFQHGLLHAYRPLGHHRRFGVFPLAQPRSRVNASSAVISEPVNLNEARFGAYY
jgi:hypothetical protein